MRDQEMVCLENEKLIKKVEECEQFHSFGGKSKVSDLVRHRKNGSNTSLPEMINNNNFKQVHYDSSSAVSPLISKLLLLKFVSRFRNSCQIISIFDT